MLKNTQRIPTDTELIAGMKNGRQSDLATAYDRYAPALFDLILKITGKKETSEEILQTVFLTAWNQIPATSDTVTPLFTQLMKLARTAALQSAFSKEGAQQIQTAGMRVGKPDTSVSREQTVLDLMYYKGMSLGEIASQLNMDPELVKVTLRKAMSHLKEAAKV